MNTHVPKIAVLAAALGLAMSAQAQYSTPQAQKAIPTPPASSSSQKTNRIPASDKSFMEKAAMGGLAEVQEAKIAQQKAQAPEVRQFADRMVRDHTKANDQLEEIARSKGVQLPDKLDKSAQKEIDKLENLSGAQFDRHYMDHQVSDHQKVVKEFQKEAKSASDADVKRFASNTLPTLEEHLHMAQDTESVAKNEGATRTAKTGK
jgi:putative membrane protein